jgi:chaperonin GroES
LDLVEKIDCSARTAPPGAFPGVLKPTSNRLLVELIDPPPTAAGLILPRPAYGIRDSQGQRGHRGRVVAVGPGKRTKKGAVIPVEVRPGDVVIFGEFDFKRWRDVDKEATFMLISEMDVCGVEEA